MFVCLTTQTLMFCDVLPLSTKYAVFCFVFNLKKKNLKEDEEGTRNKQTNKNIRASRFILITWEGGRGQ